MVSVLVWWSLCDGGCDGRCYVGGDGGDGGSERGGDCRFNGDTGLVVVVIVVKWWSL